MKFQTKIFLFISMGIAIMLIGIMGIISFRLHRATDEYIRLFSRQTAANARFLLDNYFRTHIGEREVADYIDEIERNLKQKKLKQSDLQMIQKIVSSVEVAGKGYLSVYLWPAKLCDH